MRPKTGPRNHTISRVSTTSILPAMQDLTYVEFFAGQGNVWAAVRADHHPAVPVDIEYMSTGPDRKNPMDINSDAGMAFFAQSHFKTH